MLKKQNCLLVKRDLFIFYTNLALIFCFPQKKNDVTNHCLIIVTNHKNVPLIIASEFHLQPPHPMVSSVLDKNISVVKISVSV